MSHYRDFYRKRTTEGETRPDSEEGLEHILEQMEPIPQGRLLDLGCYDGSKTLRVKGRVRAADAYGIDFDRERLETAARRGVVVSYADLNTDLPLSFPDAHFDLVVCSEVIEHLFSPDILLQEVHRLLKPQGCALLTTPNLASWKNRLVLLCGWQPFGTEVSTRYLFGNPFANGNPVRHIRMFTTRALEAAVRRYGFRLERLVGLSAPTSDTRVGRLSRLIDRTIVPHWPSLADRIVMRLGKVARIN